MIRNLISDRRARALALSLMIVSALACSRPASHPTQPVAQATTAEGAQNRLTPADLRPGTRIRYNTRNSLYGMRTGKVARASADTLWLDSSLWRLERGGAVPVASLRRLDYSPAGNTKIRKVIWGAVIGGAVGAVVGASVPPKECDRCPSGEPGPSHASDYGFTPLLVGLYGAITGGLGTALVVPD